MRPFSLGTFQYRIPISLMFLIAGVLDLLALRILFLPAPPAPIPCNFSLALTARLSK